MIQGTTPTFICKLPDTVDLTQAANVYFTIKQGQIKVTKNSDNMDIAAHMASVFLSQSDTLSMEVGNAAIQLNWTYADGSRACTKIKVIRVDPNLILEVLE